MHVHVEKGGGTAKVWLEPEIKPAYFHNLKEQEKKVIMKIITEHEQDLKSKWHEHTD